jgi:HEAT repeat protein
MSKRLSVFLLLVACGKAADHKNPPPVASDKPAPPAAPPAPTKPQLKDDAMRQMLAKGTACKLFQNQLPMDCPEAKAINEYAFQHQQSAEAAETCAAFLGDPDPNKRLLAAECLFHFTAVAKTAVLGFALDAIDAEKDPVMVERIAWGIADAEAMSAKLESRVMTEVTRLAADPKTETAASYVFSSFFPQYMIGNGPKPPIAAQTLAIASLTRDGTPMQREAFNAVTMLDDKPAVCKAIASNLRPDAKRWDSAAEAIAAMKDACIAQLAPAIDFMLARLATGDAHLAILRSYDSRFDLDPPTRAKIAKAIRAARPKASEYERADFDKTADQFSKPPKPKK